MNLLTIIKRTIKKDLAGLISNKSCQDKGPFGNVVLVTLFVFFRNTYW